MVVLAVAVVVVVVAVAVAVTVAVAVVVVVFEEVVVEEVVVEEKMHALKIGWFFLFDLMIYRFVLGNQWQIMCAVWE